jgi:HAD superfamily hydrolase (TIGR01509 family)
MKADLAEVLGPARAVLFDFDGPICSDFAGFPAPDIAYQLRSQLAETGVELPVTDDPLDVLRLAAAFGHDVVLRAEELLTAAEKAAIRSAAPTPGGEASIRACTASGRQVAVVSNNSAAAIVAYLDQHAISPPPADLVVGREYAKPHLMKPHPSPILSLLALLGVTADAAVLVGDTITDIQAATAAGVACIGYANKPEKHEQLAGAAVVIDDMQVLADQLAVLPYQALG